MSNDKIIPIGAKVDRLGQQMNMHEAMKGELRAVLDKYEGLGLMQVFISDAFADIDAESRMGALATIYDGDEPA